MDFLISVAGKIAEYAIEPVGRQFGYLIYYNSNIETLRSKVEELEDDRATVADSVAAAERNGERVLPNVQKWLNSVHHIHQELTEFLNTQVNENQKCFSRQLPCPDLVSRYRVSRKSSKKSLQVDGLLNDRINFGDQVSTPAPPPPVRAMFPGNIEAFDSRKSTFEEIMKALEDDEVNMIGVYGMGGIGKTTMVKQVAKEAEKLKLFDEFAMAVVSQKPDVRKIQCEIAEHLELKLDEETESVRAGRLYQRMNQGKTILLVLDDLWDLIDLEKIGIHDITKPKCCKIILTSRNLNVCKKMMKSMHCNPKYFIPIEVLSPTDAFGYFRANAGDAVDSSDLLPIATEIVKKCAGLPIAIKTIGLALTGKRQHDWEDVLEQLRSSTAQNIEGVHQDVYGVLEVSYKLLDSHDLKYCFLICSLFEEDANISIEDLVRYGLGLNLFQTRNRAHALVDKLKDRSLLMKGKTDNLVTMHDVTRDFAHFLASGGGEHVFLVKQGEDITEWPDRDACGHYTAISLLSHQISELPEGLDCPKLQILIFEHRWGSKLKIPSNFFQGMKQLRVLKMSGCSMTSITASIALLEGLETLCLEYSELEDLSQIGGLKKLKVLSLAQSTFKELPREIGLLTNLMILDLTGCKERNVPPNLILNLIKLECLYVLNFRNLWSWGGSNATVGELKHLDHLNTLEMCVPDINLFPNDLTFQKLIRFRVYIGDHKLEFWESRRSDLWDVEKMLVILLEPDHNNTLPTGVKTLMKRAQALVVKFEGYNYEEYPHPSALSDLSKDGFKNLMYLEVKENYRMKYLIDSSNASTPTRSFFPLLEELLLEKLGLNEICRDDLPDGSFGELRSVQISDCKELKHVFPQSALALLGQLESLTVVDCESLEGIFLEDRPEMDDVIHLPKLQILKINHVPSLTGQLLDTKIVFPALQKLMLDRCNSLVTIFPSSALRNLKSLERIEISNCELVEEVFGFDDEDPATVTAMMIPLHEIHLSNLPNLMCFGHGTTGFPSLKEMYIYDCPKMKTFMAAHKRNLGGDFIHQPFFHEKVDFPVLEHLFISGLQGVEDLWHNKSQAESFCQLQTLSVCNCSKLLKVIPLRLLLTMRNLNKISVFRCESLKEVVKIDCQITGDEGVVDDAIVTRSHLRELSLSYLPKLTELWWNKDRSGKFSCPDLRSLDVDGCHGLRNIFVPSAIKHDMNIQKLKIWNCSNMEEVVGEEEQGEYSGDKLLFRLVEMLSLWNLPNLRTFCRGNYILEWPSLSIMVMNNCPNMAKFCLGPVITPLLKGLGLSESEYNEEVCMAGSNLNDIIQHLYNKVNLPVLKILDISGLQGVEDLWHDRSQAESFCQLQTLKVRGCSKLLKVIPLRLLLTMRNLNDIYVSDYESVKEVVKIDCQITGDEGVVDDAIVTRSHLRELSLIELPKLTELWWNKDRSGKFSCPDLRSLTVARCHGLRNIFVPSAIKHDMNIQKLKIWNCSNMEEVVGEEEQGENSGDKLLFHRVKKLSLENLPNLKSFCRGNYILEWPSLSKMVMNNCPNMAKFCLGHVSTPLLKGLSEKEDNKEVLREGSNLNDIIQHLYNQKEIAAKEKQEEETSGTREAHLE